MTTGLIGVNTSNLGASAILVCAVGERHRGVVERVRHIPASYLERADGVPLFVEELFQVSF